MFLDNKRNNDGYIGLLTFINSSTRFAYVYPIKTKETTSYVGPIRELILNTRCKELTFDNEFYIEKYWIFLN